MMEKQASGRMMCVAFSDLRQSGSARLDKTSGVVFMPDCAAYRQILSSGSAGEKAALVQKFCLNLPPGVKFVSLKTSIKGKRR